MEYFLKLACDKGDILGATWSMGPLVTGANAISEEEPECINLCGRVVTITQIIQISNFKFQIPIFNSFMLCTFLKSHTFVTTL